MEYSSRRISQKLEIQEKVFSHIKVVHFLEGKESGNNGFWIGGTTKSVKVNFLNVIPLFFAYSCSTRELSKTL